MSVWTLRYGSLMGQRESSQIEWHGRVASGRGSAAPELHALYAELNAIVREPLYPGSINLVLDRPLRMRASKAATFDRGRRMVWPATLNGIGVWLYRWRSCPLHVIEVLAPIHLRTRLLLRDGDGVTLGVSSSVVGRINVVERLIWAALWLGRGDWAYSVGTYFQHVEDWGMNLGAAQQKPSFRPAALIARIIKR
jgi:hypothetical protein